MTAPRSRTGYARLLGTGDEFVAEVPLGGDGGFRFFRRPRIVDAAGACSWRAAGRTRRWMPGYGQVTKVDVSL